MDEPIEYQEVNEIQHKRIRIVRVLIIFKDQRLTVGTGFFISPTDIITNSHVVFGKGLSILKTIKEFNQANFDETEIKKFHKSITTKFEVELFDGSKKEVFLKHIDSKYDIAIIRLSSGNRYGSFFEIDTNTALNYKNAVSFCGFQCTPHIEITKWPFTYNTGMISCFPETFVEGETYEHIQINAINLGGNSGAPLFLDNYKPVGIINGNQNWGNDNLAFFDKDGKVVKDSFRVPLSIAYATSFSLLKKKSEIFKKYIEQNLLMKSNI